MTTAPVKSLIDEQLEALQIHYKDFNVLLTDVMVELGFGLTKVQADIGKFMSTGPKYLMVQAQRSQAKTTIAAAYCIHTLIHNPKARILIVSAGGSQATDISTLIIRLIMNMDVLACMHSAAAWIRWPHNSPCRPRRQTSTSGNSGMEIPCWKRSTGLLPDETKQNGITSRNQVPHQALIPYLICPKPP